MNPCTTARRVARGTTTDPLTAVAQLIDRSMPDAIVFGARFETDTIDLLVRPIERHPTTELLGFVAPADWSCIGVASGGWATPSDGDRPPRAGAERHRIRLVHAVERSGASVSLHRQAGQPPRLHRHTRPAPERAGALDDHLRRALGLPTAAAGSTLEYFAVRWIDDIFGRAADGQLAGASWPDIAALHEVHHAAAAADDPALLRWAVEHLVRAGEVMAKARPWSAVRAATIEQCERDGPAPLLTQVQWMDDGMFSRVVLGRYPPLDVLLRDLDALLDADAHQHVVATVEAWGLAP